jgi:hypothetical protein
MTEENTEAPREDDRNELVPDASPIPDPEEETDPEDDPGAD